MYETYAGVGNEKGWVFGSPIQSATRKEAAIVRNNFLAQKSSGGSQVWTTAYTRFPSGKFVIQRQPCAIS